MTTETQWQQIQARKIRLATLLFFSSVLLTLGCISLLGLR